MFKKDGLGMLLLRGLVISGGIGGSIFAYDVAAPKLESEPLIGTTETSQQVYQEMQENLRDVTANQQKLWQMDYSTGTSGERQELVTQIQSGTDNIFTQLHTRRDLSEADYAVLMKDFKKVVGEDGGYDLDDVWPRNRDETILAEQKNFSSNPASPVFAKKVAEGMEDGWGFAIFIGFVGYLIAKGVSARILVALLTSGMGVFGYKWDGDEKEFLRDDDDYGYEAPAPKEKSKYRRGFFGFGGRPKGPIN